MFETAELGHRITKKEFRARVPALREALLVAQGRLRKAPFPVVILFAGVDGAGKGSMVNVLANWMDPHYILTRPLGEPSPEESERPRYWRYWLDLPPKGHIGLFLSAWYHEPLLDHAYGKTSLEQLDSQLEDVVAFEKTLADDGALILKFWMHLGMAQQEKRLRTLQKDPLQKWRVTKRDWKHWKMYDDFVRSAERILMRTGTGDAPWHIVEGMDANYRSIRVGELILEALERRLDEQETLDKVGRELEAPEEPQEPSSVNAVETPPMRVLDRVDLSSKLTKGEYRRRLTEYQATLSRLHREARSRDKSIVMVFEGWDAAGKGGAIKRLVAALDARSVRILATAAPTDEENSQHYLWRFWRHLSRVGRVTIFDRSWYGRVLVERVEGFATEKQWRRAYAEINYFERQLVEHGIILLKFWMHISKQEQLRRFDEREKTTYKRWKLSDEDWRNRERWNAYELAVHDMVERTSTTLAPWHLIAGEEKRFARIEVLRIVVEKLKAALESKG